MNASPQPAPATKDELLSAINSRLLLQNVSGISAVVIMQTVKPFIADFCRESETRAAEAAKKELRAAMQQQIDVRGEMRDEAISEMTVALKRALAAEEESATLRKQMDAKIEDFLAEKVCCIGQDCGCMGVTRLQQCIFEEAGTELTALRGQVAALRETLAELKRNVVEIILPNAKTLTLDIGQVALWDSCVRQVDNALTSTASVPPIPDPSDTLDSRGVAEDERNPVPSAEKEKTS